MSLTIPVIAPGRSMESLADILSPLRAQGIEFSKPPSGGLAMDAGSISLIVEIAKMTLPALLAAIATVWAAKIGKNSSTKSNTQPRRRSRLVLELDASEVSIDLDVSGQPIIPEGTPENLEKIVRIRLEEY